MAGQHSENGTRFGAYLQKLALLALTILVVAAIGSKLQWWGVGLGLSVVRFVAIVEIVVFILAGIALVFYAVKGKIQGQKQALVALVLCAVPLAILLHRAYLANQLPKIHDITTDTVNPPQFMTLIPHRSPNSNSLHYEGAAVAAEQEKAYPGVQALVLANASPKDVLSHVLRLIGRHRWELVKVDADAGQVEAVATSFWFGFQDDVVIRITPEGKGSRIDMRSVSRWGRSDVGSNAERIQAFMQELAAVHNKEKARKQAS
jgi:hypothetical protein